MPSSDRLRLTIVINGLGTGGAERSIADLLPIYLSHGIEPQVVCLYKREEGVHQLVKDLGVPVLVLGARNIFGRVAELISILRSHETDLVHTSIFEADMVGRLAARFVGISVLTSLVNTSYDTARRGDPSLRPWKLNTVRHIEGLTARRMTTHFHAITQAVSDAASDALKIRRADITVIPRGRDPGRLGRRTLHRRATTRTALDTTDSTPIVLMVGRQEFQKGHIHFVEAVPGLRERFPELVVWLAGRSGTMTKRIVDRISDLGLDAHIRLLGHREDVPDLLAAADVLAFPSLYEGLGGTLIEAMALEIPIVASDLPAIREVTVSSATLVASADSSAIEEAVSGVLADRSAIEPQIAAARARFEQFYTIDRVGEAMVQLLRQVSEMR